MLEVSLFVFNVILPVVCMVVFNNFFVFNYVEQPTADFKIAMRGNSVVGTLLDDFARDL